MQLYLLTFLFGIFIGTILTFSIEDNGIMCDCDETTEKAMKEAARLRDELKHICKELKKMDKDLTLCFIKIGNEIDKYNKDRKSEHVQNIYYYFHMFFLNYFSISYSCEKFKRKWC